MKKVFLVAAFFSCSRLIAQDSSSKQLDEVIITANRFPEKESRTGKIVTVINRATLEKMGGRTLAEVLNTASATTVIGANSNLGTNLRTSIRGSSDGNVLILIDGVPVNDPSLINNYFDLNFINIANVERIEILKGGQSTLYGSDAVAGVINIITRKTAPGTTLPYARVTGGSYGTFSGTVGVKANNHKLHYDIHATATTSNGFSSAYDSTGKAGFDKDAYHEFQGGGSLGFNLTQNINATVFADYSRYKAGIDAGMFKDDIDYTATNINTRSGVALVWKQPAGSLHLLYQYGYVSRAYLNDSADKSSFAYYSKGNYIGRMHFAELYENFHTGPVEWITGADYREQNTVQNYFSVSSYGPYSQPELNKKASQFSAYASGVLHLRQLSLEMGSRWNHHNVYGNNFTYTFNPSLLVAGKAKLFANASSAYKVPSLYQLYDPYAGNKDLQPEKTTVYEAGIELYPTTALSLRANWFYSNTKNAILYVTVDPVNYISYYQNISRQKNNGAELELNYRNEKWLITGNYTYTKGSTTAAYTSSGSPLKKDTTYNNLYRVPENAASLFLSYNLTKTFSLSSLVKFTGNRLEPVYAAAPVVLKQYTTIDLSAQYTCHAFRYFVDLKNITNRQYFDFLGYNTKRFNFTLGIAYNL